MHQAQWSPERPLDAARAEGDREPRVAARVDEARGSDAVELAREEAEGLVPRDGLPAWVFTARLLRIGPAERRLDARGIVDLLDEAVGADADLAARRMRVGHIAVWLDADSHPVANHALEQIGPRHALVAVGRDPRSRAHRRAVLMNGSPFCWSARLWLRLLLPWLRLALFMTRSPRLRLQLALFMTCSPRLRLQLALFMTCSPRLRLQLAL